MNYKATVSSVWARLSPLISVKRGGVGGDVAFIDL